MRYSKVLDSLGGGVRLRDMKNIVTEAQAYEAIRLAQLNAHKGALASSAAVCAADAVACFNAGDFDFAYSRARESLRYSVGVFHPAYQAV